MTATKTKRGSRRRPMSAGLFESLIVDNFAGGGGASTGLEMATGRAVDLAINHDPEAILMHSANHPHTRHLSESVFSVDPVAATGGRPVGIAWFSPDCTHFSKAKGSKPLKKAIRGLAWVVCRWAGLVAPQVIFLENVSEFQDWGPLNRNRRPIKSRKGETFRKWVAQLQALGYAVEWKVLNAADHGAPTHRRRLFVIARRDGRPIRWPAPTHGPGRAKPYRTAAECIDWSIPCPSIFDRKKPLAEKTMRRTEFRGQSIDQPLSTVTGSHGYGVVVPTLVGVGGPGYAGKPAPVNQPIGTVTTENHRALMTAHLTQFYGEAPHQDTRAQSPDAPLNTVVATPKHALVTATLVECANSNWSHGTRPVDQPAATITAQPKGGSWALCSAFLAKHFGGVVGHEVTRPLGTVTAKDHHSVVAAHLLKYYGTSTGQPLDGPAPTVTGQGQHAALVYSFLMKFYGQGGQWQDVGEPLHTIPSKDRFGLVTVDVDGEPYVITDIGLRMLTPRELALAQGFPPDYKLPSVQSKAVRFIGNSVPPPLAAAVVRANVRGELDEVAA